MRIAQGKDRGQMHTRIDSPGIIRAIHRTDVPIFFHIEQQSGIHLGLYKGRSTNRHHGRQDHAVLLDLDIILGACDVVANQMKGHGTIVVITIGDGGIQQLGHTKA